VTINKSIWDEDEKIWWYLVEGFNSYEMYGRTVSGWISGEILTVNPPQPYPLGIAWTDFYAGDDIGMGINIWSEPGYLNTGGGGHVVGELIIGNQIEMIDRQWDEGSELWFYRVDGDDKNTRENVSGWLDGVFIVLTQP
jgi:hypothetical protein